MFQAVVFDFDLTLADSSAGVVECITYALSRRALPPLLSIHPLTVAGGQARRTHA